jgi:trehalose 6-phosphate synthase
VSVVVVSNRVTRAKKDEPITGGLAAALLPMVESSGAIWVGSSGRTRDVTTKDSFAEIEALGSGALAQVDLPEAHYRRYYEGFANSALWPALHSRPDLIRVTLEDYRSYREVNAFMARALLRFRQNDTAYWVQDYHFLALGAELRKLGVKNPIGFFLHTPWATHSSMVGVPHHRELVSGMLAYDVVGFQTADDRRNFTEYLELEFGVKPAGDVVRSPHGATRIGVFPIGIDVEAFAARAARAFTSQQVAGLKESLYGAKLAIGVDRIDYSKGLANRFRAFDCMLLQNPDLKRQISLLQIAVPSRRQIDTYNELNTKLATLVGDINGRHGEVDWVPVRYLNKAFAQTTLAGLYRVARVGLVTPLHDGMNLVAKEYVAAQDPADPGVLVLSKFAGAAHELSDALIVNPHDIDGMARDMQRALVMPLDERRNRWDAMMAKLKAHSIQSWFTDFLQALDETRAAAPLRKTLQLPSTRGEQPIAAQSG